MIELINDNEKTNPQKQIKILVHNAAGETSILITDDNRTVAIILNEPDTGFPICLN